MTKSRTLLLLAALLSACSSSSSALEESRAYKRHGHHLLAFDVLERERQRLEKAGSKPSAEFEATYRETEIDYVMYLVRRDIFEEREEQALGHLQQAAALGASKAEIEWWHKRAVHKMAVRATRKGDEHFVKGELEQALECYLRALGHEPENKLAMEGAERVRTAVLRLTQRAQQQFLEAVRKLPEFRYVEVEWHALNAITNDPSRGDAQSLADRAAQKVLDAQFARGVALRDADQFGAALLAFREIRRRDPGYAGIDAAIEAMTREVEASRLVEAAKLDMRMERFDAADQGLDDALTLSELSRASIGELKMLCRQLRAEAAYRDARDLEILGKKEEALAAFEALMAAWPAGVRDEAARVDALRVDVEGAKTEWAAAEAAETAGDLNLALEHYRNALRYYPGWKDGAARVAKLEAKLAAGKSEG